MIWRTSINPHKAPRVVSERHSKNRPKPWVSKGKICGEGVKIFWWNLNDGSSADVWLLWQKRPLKMLNVKIKWIFQWHCNGLLVVRVGTGNIPPVYLNLEHGSWCFHLLSVYKDWSNGPFNNNIYQKTCFKTQNRKTSWANCNDSKTWFIGILRRMLLKHHLGWLTSSLVAIICPETIY